jgi:hypothetical protein
MFRSKIAVFAAALAFAAAAFAQAAADNSSASSPPASTMPKNSTIELPSVPANTTAAPEASAPAAATSTPTSQTAVDPNAIGGTSLTRLDTSNTAFEKLAPDRAYLTPADLAQLPRFGNAFAKADRDNDGRLDRTEFSDAWTYYIGPEANAVSSTASEQSTPAQSASAQ